MPKKSDVDDLIREALQAEGVEGLELPGEPGLPDMVTAVFRGRMWWVGAYMLLLILVGAIMAVVCAVKFFGADDVPGMIRWGAGFFFCVLVAIGCKFWYWMQMERLAMTREIKRVELLVAHLASELRRETK